jgi:hypothetical protein
VLQMTGPIIHFHGTGGWRKFERNHAIKDKKWKEL